MSPEPPPLVEPAESPQPALVPVRAPFWGWRDVGLFFGLGLPLILIAQVLLGLIAQVLHQTPSSPVVLVAGQTLAYLLLFVLLAAILRLEYNAPFWQSLGWVPSRVSPLSAVAIGVFLAFGLAILGGLLRIPNAETPFKKMLESQQGAIVVAIFGVLVAPLAEELAFRGFLQPLMVRTLGVIGGIAITAVLFGLLHWEQNGKSWGVVAVITLAGVGFGVLRHISKSTRASILAHVAYNSTLFVAFFAYGRKTAI